MEKLVKFVLISSVLSFVGCASHSISKNNFQEQENYSPNQVLDFLKTGNEHFVNHKNCFPHLDEVRMKEEVNGQHPMAVVVSCSDSRVPIELVFDQGIGDLFVVRTAGNSLDNDMTMGSLEYAIHHLHAKVIIVVGHEKCGGINAAISHHNEEENQPKEISNLINTLKKGVEPFVGKVDKLDDAIHYNIEQQIHKLLQNDEIKNLIDNGRLKVVGGYYHLNNGKVDFIN